MHSDSSGDLRWPLISIFHTLSTHMAAHVQHRDIYRRKQTGSVRGKCPTQFALYALTFKDGWVSEVSELLFSKRLCTIFQPRTDGYLAIVSPKLKDFKGEINKLDSQDTVTTDPV